mmetsp:Transcript_20427/g.56699  ORF Transcript_20427/g.56699 Transcript_20427/m.56699 type:complete len:116 (-) Transcript_20427:249-596(-)
MGDSAASAPARPANDILQEGWMEGRSEKRKWFRLRAGRSLEYADSQDGEEFTPVNFHGCKDPVLIPVVEDRATMKPVPRVFHFRAGGYYVLYTCETDEDYDAWIAALSKEFIVSD